MSIALLRCSVDENSSLKDHCPFDEDSAACSGQLSIQEQVADQIRSQDNLLANTSARMDDLAHSPPPHLFLVFSRPLQ